METIDVELSDFTLRCRSLRVSHVAARLPRGLEPGEQVVLHDAGRGYWSAHVADLGFEPTDTIYRLALGARLSPEEALERTLGTTPTEPGVVTVQEVVDLLGRLRAAGRTIPAPCARDEDAAL